jgi:tryptophan halogenase
MKKLAIIGRGTAGCFAAIHFLKWSNWNIDFYYDPSIKPQTVGEGINLAPAIVLRNCLDFSHEDLAKVDGTFKTGIWKTGWGIGNEFMHTFRPPNVAYHFNAVKLQEYIISKIRIDPRVKIIEENAVDVDADFVMDCSGKPSSYENFNNDVSIPVNAVHVTQCYWPHPAFQYTLAIARPHGWVFGIPLQNRCSIGYMYNHTISSLNDVKEDVKQVFADYNLTPSQDRNTFQFNNYYRKENHHGRVSYNGNSSFFLEPLEATSIAMMDKINRQAFDHWTGVLPLTTINTRYVEELQKIENMIMMHYFAGSIFDTKFWEFAQPRGEQNMKLAMKKLQFANLVSGSKNFTFGKDENKISEYGTFGTWELPSFKQNLLGLGLYDKSMPM